MTHSAFTVSPATPAHTQAISDIEGESYATPWSYQTLAHTLCDENMISFAVFDGAALVGYTFMRVIFEEGHIENIAVAPQKRGLGISSLLMSALFGEAQARGLVSITLEVRQGNRPAMALYHKFGFKVEGYRRDYYKDPNEDAIIMRRLL